MHWISLVCAETCGKTCSAVLQHITLCIHRHGTKLTAVNSSMERVEWYWLEIKRCKTKLSPIFAALSPLIRFAAGVTLAEESCAAREFVAGKSTVVLTWQTGCQHWFADPPVTRGAVGHTAALHGDSCPNLSVAPVRINHLSRAVSECEVVLRLLLAIERIEEYLGWTTF